MSCCDTTSDGAVASGGGAGEVRGFEIDLTTQTPGALASGAVSFNASMVVSPVSSDGDPVDFTALIAGGGESLTIGPTGAVWDEGTTNTTFTSTAQTATHIFATFQEVFDFLDTDSSWVYRVDTYFSAVNLLNAETLLNAIWGVSGTPANAADRLSGGGRARQAATQVWRPAVQAGGVNYTTAPGPTTNVTGIVCSAQAMSAHAGTWPVSGTPAERWAALRVPVQWGIGKLQDAGLSSPMLDANTRVVPFALGTNGVAGTSSGTIERFRILAFNPFAS